MNNSPEKRWSGFIIFFLSIVFRVLSFPSGVNNRVIKYGSVLSNYYLKIGIAVWNNAALSALGMGLMASQSQVELTTCVILAACWFWFVVHLDRFLLSNSKFKSSRAKITVSILRFAMALLLAVVIGEQLVQWAFRSDIEAQLTRSQVSRREQTLMSLRASDIEVNQLENDKAQTQNQIQNLQQKVESTRDEYIKEAEGTAGSGLTGKGPLYLDKLNNYNAAVGEKKSADEKLQKIEERLQNRYARIEKDLLAVDNAQSADRGFLARHHALIELIQKDWTMGILYVFISTLLILFEVIPLIIKFNSDESDYRKLFDRTFLLEDTEHKIRFDAQINKHKLQQVFDQEYEALQRKNIKKAAEALRKNSFDNLSPEVLEIINKLRASDLDRADSLPSPKTTTAVDPVNTVPHAELNVVVKNDVTPESFTVIFNQPSSKIFGKDFVAILSKLEHNRPPGSDQPHRPLLTEYEAQNADGMAIEPLKPLFEQLSADQVLYLISPTPSVSEANN